MTNQTLGILVGGLLPALFFGLSGVFARPAAETGIGLGLYVIIVGLAIALVGAGIYWVQPDPAHSTRGIVFSALVGMAWAIGAGLVAIALQRYEMPLSTLVPLYNMNTLVAVLIGLAVFAEWRDVHAIKLIAGAILITIGGTLVANA